MSKRTVSLRLFVAELVNATASVETGVVRLDRLQPTAVVGQVTSVLGTPDCKLEYCVSLDGTTFGAYTDNPPLIASTVGEFSTAEGVSTVEVAQVPAVAAKYKITGVGANPADTLATLTLLVVEE